MIIQFCGLSGSGKSTIAHAIKTILDEKHIKMEILDGDVYRKTLYPDLGFSKADRQENIRRLAFIAGILERNDILPIICAINPYEDSRQEVKNSYQDVKTIYLDCPVDTLIKRDTKQLYRRALLPNGHPEKIPNLTGINDTFDIPLHPDLILKTGVETVEMSTQKLQAFILPLIGLT